MTTDRALTLAVTSLTRNFTLSPPFLSAAMPEERMKIFDWLFGSTPDNRNRRAEDAERKISIAMPMAGASAEVAAEHVESETEKELREATGEK